MSDSRELIIAHYEDLAKAAIGDGDYTWFTDAFSSLKDMRTQLSTRKLNLKLDTILKAISSGAASKRAEVVKAQLRLQQGAAIKRAANFVYGSGRNPHADRARAASYAHQVTVDHTNNTRKVTGDA